MYSFKMRISRSLNESAFAESTPNEQRRSLFLVWFSSNKIDIDIEYGKLRINLRRDLNNDDQFKAQMKKLITSSTAPKPLLTYIDVLSRFIKMHDKFYDGIFALFVNTLINKEIDDLPKEILQQMLYALKSNFQIDQFHTVISGSVKRIIELNAERISREHNFSEGQFLNLITPTHAVFLKEYTVKHLRYINADPTVQDLIIEKLAARYHLNSKVLAKHRIETEFSNISKDMLRTDSNLRTQQNAVNQDEETSAIAELVNFDNYYEYLYAKKLEGVSGFALRLYLTRVLAVLGKLDVSDHPLSKATEVKMTKLIERKIQNKNKRFLLNRMSLYHQSTELTCGASCAMMVENYFRNTQMNKQKEQVIYDSCSITTLEGTHESALALYLKKLGLRTRIIHENPNILSYWDKIPKDIFEKAERFYRAKLKEAEEAGVELHIDTIDAKSFIKQLNDGYVPIASIMLPGQILHSIIIRGYSKSDTDLSFDVLDPLNGNYQLSEVELNKLINLPFGKVLVAASGFEFFDAIKGEVDSMISKLNGFKVELGLI